jgi:hypothetical protein
VSGIGKGMQLDRGCTGPRDATAHFTGNKAVIFTVDQQNGYTGLSNGRKGAGFIQIQ